ncbi:nitrous oxide reductase family maturation protein NosD [Desulfosporosinus sp. SYSU MS00001]|uniref:nitrous oxide reductase family maturation protein NosD n=1 Tax=Desulfosporosinus sp. SYSU MS00001 TaxID=3416284 RepID=UPI003CE81F2D
MKISRKFTFCFVLLGSLLLFPVPAKALNGHEITVGPTGMFHDINSAIVHASPGDTIKLQKGVYQERLTINKPLNLIGEEGVVIDGGGQENIILVDNSQNVAISRLSLRNSGGSAVTPYAGIKLVNSKAVNISRITMSSVEYGVYLDTSNHCKLDNIVVTGKKELMPEDRGDGLGFWNSSYNQVANSHISYVRDGALFVFSPFNQVVSNRFDFLRYGLHYMYSNNNTFNRNIFSDSVAGATPMYSKNMVFTHNIFAHMPGERAYGILLKDCEQSTFTDNLILESNVGVQFDHAIGNEIKNNLIINCGVGFQVLGNSTANLFTGNSLRDNIVQVATDYGALPNTWTEDGKGNYWSDYVGYDFLDRGIGERPYASINYLAQAIFNQPVLQLFADSPGLQAVARGLQLFPLWNFPSITDENPLMHPPAIEAEWSPWLKNPISFPEILIFDLITITVLALGIWLIWMSRRRRCAVVKG